MYVEMDVHKDSVSMAIGKCTLLGSRCGSTGAGALDGRQQHPSHGRANTDMEYGFHPLNQGCKWTHPLPFTGHRDQPHAPLFTGNYAISNFLAR